MTSDRFDRDGVPWPTDPPPELDDAPPPASNVRPLRAAPTALAERAGLPVSSLGEVLGRVAQAGPPGWLVEGL